MSRIDKRPNFLVIVADDLGFSDVGCFGAEIQTPNLDRLASQGIRMTGFHTAAACSPTRSMLLSGTDNHIAGVGAMPEHALRKGNERYRGRPGHEGRLNHQVAALPEVLQQAGYYTVMSGKWHLGGEAEYQPHSRGFDHSYVMLAGCHNHYGHEPQFEDGDNTKDAFKTWCTPMLKTIRQLYKVDGQDHDFPANYPYTPNGFYSSETFGDEMIKLLQKPEAQTKPFFAYLPFTAPHWPLQAPKHIRDVYKGVYDDGPEVLRQRRLKRLEELGLIEKEVEPHPVVNAWNSIEWDKLTDYERKCSARAMETYAAMVHAIDLSVGKVLKQIDDMGETDNTFVVFMSDNGAEGSAYEVMPIMGTGILKVITKYYDNSLENIGEPNSFPWYGPFWAQASTAPSRLMKHFNTQGGIRVPFILRYPPAHQGTGARPGSIVSDITTVMDIMPTILDLADVQHPTQSGGNFRGRQVMSMRGKSWRGLLQNGTSPHPENEAFGWELHGKAAMRRGDWKICFVPPPHGTGKWELFDLSKDPGETHDLRAVNPGKFAELSRAWDQYVNNTGVVWGAPPSTETVGDEELREAGIKDLSPWLPGSSGGSELDEIFENPTAWMQPQKRWWKGDEQWTPKAAV